MAARILAALCAASIRGSSCCARSHQTVAFCFRMRATYEVGEAEDVLREEVDRRGTLPAFCPEFVGTRWRPVLVLVEEVEVALERVRRVG